MIGPLTRGRRDGRPWTAWTSWTPIAATVPPGGRCSRASRSELTGPADRRWRQMSLVSVASLASLAEVAGRLRYLVAFAEDTELGGLEHADAALGFLDLQETEAQGPFRRLHLETRELGG